MCKRRHLFTAFLSLRVAAVPGPGSCRPPSPRGCTHWARAYPWQCSSPKNLNLTIPQKAELTFPYLTPYKILATLPKLTPLGIKQHFIYPALLVYCPYVTDPPILCLRNGMKTELRLYPNPAFCPRDQPSSTHEPSSLFCHHLIIPSFSKQHM